ncbi:unnamed protein product [Urochloa decumbens]|uniref:DUF1618 domain-containing protein n=1 Tax=Urochloa decumbens TaxID=240449 RepID=A0ABC9GBV6_9POAL
MEAQPQYAAYPRWVMLEQYLEIIKVKVENPSRSTTEDDAKTLAAARTINSHPIQVSLRLAEPPALSRVFLRIPHGLSEDKSKVLAAHGDSVLIQVCIREKDQRYHTFEHFVYNAGDHAADPPRPPSLWLLPPYYEYKYSSGSNLVPRELCDAGTGLLRRGDDDFAVAEITGPSKDTLRVAKLNLFRSGKWSCYRFEIRESWDLQLWDTVVPLDDRLLCWVDLDRAIMLLDVFRETPRVQYVQLPMGPIKGGLNRNVCTTAGGGTLKFVNIFGRCCCGAAASCDCNHAYIIDTWTMRISNEDVVDWVQDGMVDATELWALDAYKGLPCNDPLDRPIVSIDEPEFICFRLRDPKYDNPRNRALWQILVNMRSKTMHSVSRHEEDLGYCYARDKLIPSKVSHFFNIYPDSGKSGDATLTGQSQVDIKRSPSVVVDVQPKGDGDASDPTLQPFSSALQASEIFEALQEIPSYGLGPDEVKAYRILSHNNGCRMISLLRLPKSLRKNWLLIEIKANED